jgi:hypothetical protein
MKIILIVVQIALFFTFPPLKPQETKLDTCELIDDILNSKYINNILGLKKAEESRPPIRITDLTGTFMNCGSFYKRENPNLIIEYFVVDELSFDINTGHCRDLIMIDYENTIDTINVSLFAATFETNYGVSTNYAIHLKFRVLQNGDFELLNEEGVEVFYKRLKPDYKKF